MSPAGGPQKGSTSRCSCGMNEREKPALLSPSNTLPVLSCWRCGVGVPPRLISVGSRRWSQPADGCGSSAMTGDFHKPAQCSTIYRLQPSVEHPRCWDTRASVRIVMSPTDDSTSHAPEERSHPLTDVRNDARSLLYPHLNIVHRVDPLIYKCPSFTIRNVRFKDKDI